MFCYADRTFCAGSEKCPHKECKRNFTEEHEGRANRWAKSAGLKSPPIALSNYQDKCEVYKPKEEKEND